MSGLSEFEKGYVNDLETAFTQALKNKNFATAIRAKELQARVMQRADKDNKKGPLRLKDLSKDDIQQLIHDLEAYAFHDQDLMNSIKSLFARSKSD